MIEVEGEIINNIGSFECSLQVKSFFDTLYLHKTGLYETKQKITPQLKNIYRASIYLIEYT